MAAAAAVALFARAGVAQDIDAVALRAYDVLFIGEVHDNPSHHEVQARIIYAVGPSAIVFEMLDPDEAAQVTPALAADPEALRAVLDWDNSGWPDFSYYAPLLAFAAYGVPIFGAEVPREEAQAAFEVGAAGAFGIGAERFGLDTPLLDDQQAAREAEQMVAHCDALPEDILPGFVEAQRLRDARLAEAALAALEAHGGPVVVIAGNGHVRVDWGAPALLALADPSVSMHSIGQIELAEGDQMPTDLPYEYAFAAAPIDRPDPCAAFR